MFGARNSPPGTTPRAAASPGLRTPFQLDESEEEDDPHANDLSATNLVSGEPKSPNLISFKRRKQAQSRYSLFANSAARDSAPTLVVPEPSYNSPLNHAQATAGPYQASDDASGTDDILEDSEKWDTDDGARRFYDDLTAIDWIFEYTKEKLRLKKLAAQGGLYGYLASVFDSSQIWIVLICTGIAAGSLAACIDIVANWLGDLKDGYCQDTFYLSRTFCCWGLEASETCNQWVSWSSALHVGAGGGAYIVRYIFYCMFSILFAVSASMLVITFAPYARHSGIPEIKTILGGFVIRKFMGAWTLVIKSLGLCLAESSGMWLGKEGPLVHVACCCANLVMKPFSSINNNEARKREILSAAASAGISVAFGSPIGGVLFSLEQLSYYFPDKTMWQSFVCAMVAAVTLQYLDPFRTGKLVLYQVKYTRGWHGFEMIPFCILGILGGLYGAGFIWLNMKFAAWRKNSLVRLFPVVEVVVVTLLTALINYPTVFMRPQSSELVANLFQECSPQTDDFFGLCKAGQTPHRIILLIVSSLLGILLASATFGLSLPAGIILPSMAIGALYGRALGMVVQSWQRSYPSAWFFSTCEPDIECVTPGMFAIIGAASALGGVTRMTVSIVVITFELTGALTYVLPIMIAVMISKWVGDAFGKRGIYESWIQFKEYPFLENRDDPVPDIPVVEIMTRIEDLIVITQTGHTIDSLEEILRSHPYKGFPVVSDTRGAGLVGYIARSELRYALHQARHIKNLLGHTDCMFSNVPAGVGAFVDMRPWMDHTPITLQQSSSLSLTATLFQKLGLRYILFAKHGELQGLLTKKDVYFILNSEERLNNEQRECTEGRSLLGHSQANDVASEYSLESPGEDRSLLDSM